MSRRINMFPRASRPSVGALAALTVGSAVALPLASCREAAGPIDGPVRISRLEPPEIGIGLDSLVLVEATVGGSKDDPKGQLLFQTLGGRFETAGTKSAAVVRRLVNGKARVFLNPPEETGGVLISVAGEDSKADTVLRVVAAPAPMIDQLPDTVAVKTKVLVKVTAGPWRLRPVEIRTSSGTLLATGAVDSEMAMGTTVKPILDELGVAFVQWSAPEEAGTTILSANLFGSTSSRQVVVREP